MHGHSENTFIREGRNIPGHVLKRQKKEEKSADVVSKELQMSNSKIGKYSRTPCISYRKTLF